MSTRTMLAGALILSSGLAHAATWNVFAMHDAKALYFFDSDTVVRSGETVTLLNKQVNNASNPNADGSYSTAFMQSFDCAKRETRILSMVTYDKNHEMMRTYRTPGRVMHVATDAGALDYLLNAACLPHFPASAKGTAFYPARNNDEYQYAADYFSFLREKADDSIQE
jgi:hypothetical protein